MMVDIDFENGNGAFEGEEIWLAIQSLVEDKVHFTAINLEELCVIGGLIVPNDLLLEAHKNNYTGAEFAFRRVLGHINYVLEGRKTEEEIIKKEEHE